MPSFDIVSEVDQHELTNAVDQASREITTRFDFKGIDAKYNLDKDAITLTAPSDFQVKQMLDIVQNKLVARKIDLKSLDIGEMQANLSEAKIVVTVKQGIDQPTAKKLSKLIKDSKLKVQTQIQGDKVRVTGKKRDDLQSTMALLKDAELECALQYDNFRD
jgi:cyclic-di-GMP-binding protein